MEANAAKDGALANVGGRKASGKAIVERLAKVNEPEVNRIPEFFEWFRTKDAGFSGGRWLILGKGPTFARINTIDRSGYLTFGLNHVVAQTPVTIAHAIDIDVMVACQDVLEENAEYVVLPLYPHVKNEAGKKQVHEYFSEIPALGRLAAAGRLFWYNASTAAVPSPAHEIVPVKYFSAEAAVYLLAMAGVKHIRTLGIDGGASYSGEFSRLGTLLANGRQSFNKQFKEIAGAIMKYDLDYAAHGADSPIRVFVATTEAQMLAVKVLEYSIRKNTAMSVEVLPLHECGVSIPQPRDQKNWPRTPFSFQRFIIPQVCGFKGRAIYLDSDMQVFSDIREVWEMDMQGGQLISAQDAKEGGRKPQYSVMLLDCEGLGRWNIAEMVAALDSGELSYEDLMYRMSTVERQAALIPSYWNSLESYREGETKLLHYTDMDTQPWIYNRHPLGYLWCQDLFTAIKEGFIDRAMVDEHIKKGWARPSLRYQLDHSIVDPLLLPKSARDLDRGYQAPFLGIHQHSAKPWTSFSGAFIAAMRRMYYLSPLPALYRMLRSRRERYE